MKINFQKYHGAGNDFIIISNRELELLGLKLIPSLCARKTGIGADGLIAITPPERNSRTASFRYFNADGGEADFCGNGLRCAAMFCYINFKRKNVTFKTNAGILNTKIVNTNKVSIEVPVNRQPEKINLDNECFFFCNTGVPHVIQIVKDIQSIDVVEKGKEIRFHKFFSPHGTNANFAEILSDSKIAIRTYERGVEAETEACGSGAAATALSLAIFANLKFPIKVMTKSGYILTISKLKQKNKIDKLILEGPAERSFSGEIII